MQKTLRRTAIFAHYDKDNLIQDYVIYYLKELKKIADTVVFVSDTNLLQCEIAKLSGIADVIISKPHGEYDFGSYKIGFNYLKEKNILNNIDELIFANDSCFGPLLSFKTVWEEMNNKSCDFWGICYNLSGESLHVQSYFLVFKRQVFKSEVFKDFMQKITKQKSKDEIVKKYEIGLSSTLINNKFIPETYFAEKYNLASELVFWDKMSPLIKICTAKRMYRFIYRIILKILYKKYQLTYPQNLIWNYLEHYSKPADLFFNLRIVKQIFFRFRLKEKRCYLFGKWFNW